MQIIRNGSSSRILNERDLGQVYDNLARSLWRPRLRISTLEWVILLSFSVDFTTTEITWNFHVVVVLVLDLYHLYYLELKRAKTAGILTIPTAESPTKIENKAKTSRCNSVRIYRFLLLIDELDSMECAHATGNPGRPFVQ
jgi:hypothetical protein